MNLLFLVHYPPAAGASMRAYGELLVEGLASRGHSCRTTTAPVLLRRLAPRGRSAAKWLGYLDQFLLFPPLLRHQLRHLPPATLVVVIDQALGPWIPWLVHLPHVVHVHDLLAWRSSRGAFPQHRLSRSGRLYQRWIRHGFRQARRFLCVSEATRRDLLPLLPSDQQRQHCAVLPNPLLPPYQQALMAGRPVSSRPPEVPTAPFLLHIGSTWYKNRLAVLAIGERLFHLGRCQEDPMLSQLQIVLVGPPDAAMQRWLEARPELQPRLQILAGTSQATLIALYRHAAALLFPSFAEGFGWPVLEALACGCPVITTAIEPITAVAGEAAAYLPPCAPQALPPEPWLAEAEAVVLAVLQRSAAERAAWRQRGLAQARRFALPAFLDQLECHYSEALACATSA